VNLAIQLASFKCNPVYFNLLYYLGKKPQCFPTIAVLTNNQLKLSFCLKAVFIFSTNLEVIVSLKPTIFGIFVYRETS
jgi:hypothetical protein